MTIDRKTGTLALKTGLAEMLKGGVIMDVTNEEQAKIAEDAGAVAVMALERVPADIRREGGVARMADPTVVERIMGVVTIPVMAKCRIGHFAEARVLESLGVDFIDESEVLTPADEAFHVDKHAFKAPFVCGCRDLGEALRRIGVGAALVRTKGEAGTGNVVEAVRHMRQVMDDIRRIQNMPDDELYAEAKRLGAPVELVREVKPGVAAARNRGVREAQGSWIAFFDDDQIADRHWLSELRAGKPASAAMDFETLKSAVGFPGYDAAEARYRTV